MVSRRHAAEETGMSAQSGDGARKTMGAGQRSLTLNNTGIRGNSWQNWVGWGYSRGFWTLGSVHAVWESSDDFKAGQKSDFYEKSPVDLNTDG